MDFRHRLDAYYSYLVYILVYQMGLCYFFHLQYIYVSLLSTVLSFYALITLSLMPAGRYLYLARFYIVEKRTLKLGE